MTTPVIGVTLGDPGGVGPEIVIKALTEYPPPPDIQIVIFGDSRTIGETGRLLGVDFRISPWNTAARGEGGLYLKDISVPAGKSITRIPSRESGLASFNFFEDAVNAAAEGQISALVTAPISKASWQSAGVPWRGHTEYLEHLYPHAIMSFWSEPLKVALFSHHLSLGEALDKVRKQGLLHFFRALHGGLSALGLGGCELLVAGLNPHAGEDGLLGTEEESEVRPAVDQARAEGIPISGPFPPDTVFLRARNRAETMAVALYHDQGLVPFKLLAFETGVNVTLGLPFIRTSPDHGTAFDIAGKGIADPRSMAEALKLALSFSAAVS